MISSDHLEPGTAGRIKASVETAGRSGRLDKYISIYSNDPRNPVTTLILTLEIVQK